MSGVDDLMFENFTPVSATLGGAFIGLSASILLLSTGRIAGISGITRGLLQPAEGDTAWRAAFLVGLLCAGVTASIVDPSLIAASASRSLVTTAIAGLVVGVGVTLGNGCTSGHGVCGLSRFSTRSLAATLTFMGTGFLTATLVQMFAGGAL